MAIYIIFTGDLTTALQGVLFGIQGGGETEFAGAMLTSLLVDLMLIAPVLLLTNNRLGILHPLLLAVVIWPLLLRMPSVAQELGDWAALFLGDPVDQPFFLGLGWRPGPEVWLAIAKFNLLQLIALAATYVGFSVLRTNRFHLTNTPRRAQSIDQPTTRKVLIFLIALSFSALLIIISVRGGVVQHIADMAMGRFRSLAGFGPLLAVTDLGLIALMLWMAIRPSDAKSPLFWVCLLTVAATQFISNGARSAALTVFISTGIVWALRTRRVPWRLALALVPLVFFALGVLGLIRSSGLTNQSSSSAVVERSASDILQGVQEELQLRRALSAQVPVVEDGFEVTNGPLLGRSYLAAILAPIPRTIWEAKPRGPGSLYTQLFLGEVREGAAVPVGPTAEAYWNFGIPGVLVIFLLYGVAIKQMHAFYEKRSEDPFILCFYVLFLTSFRFSTDELVLFQQQVAMLLLSFLIIRAIAGRQKTVGESATIPRKFNLVEPGRLS